MKVFSRILLIYFTFFSTGGETKTIEHVYVALRLNVYLTVFLLSTHRIPVLTAAPGTNPTLKTTLAVIKALGIGLTVKA